ncbi:glycosyltransferase [Curtobacterium flaccumfaciens pv. flaccumfaciens]|uniref:glycosyltransferase n=1 Tax=Curtobacterium flaccumfaciens TaxID=2035 RepID=UPI00217E7425|nr:glycosyltransferase [Curtobacterium flaccumfaciens]MCS6550351.1 glycosyltransferase [Curtobacterium flaccumfaciens pv. flaccumfaciens]
MPSEPFIVDQASRLKRYTPVLLARDRFAPRSIPGYSLSGESRFAGMAYRAGFRSALRPLFSAARVQLIHAHFGVDAFCALAAARAASMPMVVTLHGFDVTLDPDEFRRSYKPAWRQYYRGRSKLLSSSDIEFVAVSRFVAQKAIALGVDDERITVVPTGVDTSSLLPSPLPEVPRIVHVARLVEVKGTEFLLRAVARLARVIAAVHLDIVGDGPLREDLEELAESLGLANHITFHGALPHNEALTLIGQARVLCLPSVRAASGAAEGLGQVSLEAMALGRIVVASDSGGIAEVVRNGETGVLVSERQPAELARALEFALTSERAGALAENGRKMVVSAFDSTKQAGRLEDVYDRAWRSA